MNIIIAGDGEVGMHLAHALVNGNHNITVVDPHEDLLKMVNANTDLMTITGSSTSIEVLQRANVKHADLVISVLHEEHINLITAILAKKLGAKKVVARVNTMDNLSPRNLELYHELGIDDLISPEDIASKEIIGLLKQSAATEVFEFSGGKLSMILVKIEANAPVVNKTLNDIAAEYKQLDFRAVAIHRKRETFIPRGNDAFRPNDLVYVITKPEAIGHLMTLGGKMSFDINNLMIVGGGRVGRQTAKQLEKEINIKILDTDKERCLYLTDFLEDTLVINGDARNIQLLDDEGLKRMDAFVAVTDSTETNILTCLHASKMGVKRTIALVENIDYIDISQNIGIDTIINKKLITAGHIVRFTMNAEVTSIKCLSGIEADVLELIARKKSPVTKRPICKINIPEGAIIGGIVRNGEGLIATGNQQIEENDKVVVFALPQAMHKIEKLFR